MDILRKLAVGFLAMVLFGSSLGMAWADVAARTFRNREVVKEWLEESDFYDSITPAVLENVDIPKGENGDHLPIDDPKLQKKLNSVLDEKYLRDNTGTVLDGMYDWLEGNTDQPDFSINLGDTRRKLAAAIGDYAGERAADLPACKSIPKDTNPLTLTCLPKGTSPKTVAASAEAELLKNKDFLSESTLTAEDLVGEGQENPADSVNSSSGNSARSLYKLGGYGNLVLGAIALLSALGIIFLSSSRTIGMRRAGITLISSAVLLGITFGLMHVAPNRLNAYLGGQSDGTATQNLFARMFDVVVGDVRSILGWYSLIFALIGAGLIISGYMIKKRGAKNLVQQDLDPVPPIDDSPKTTASDKLDVTSNPDDKPRKV
ncbi:MAG: hypothetical protein M3Q14_00660 [bacterium]|nr:hypothetical protein [bacterium]